jgi:hypothetical protein
MTLADIVAASMVIVEVCLEWSSRTEGNDVLEIKCVQVCLKMQDTFRGIGVVVALLVNAQRERVVGRGGSSWWVRRLLP